MAGWTGGVGVGKQLYSHRTYLEVALIFIATCVTVPTSYAENGQGFISLDCGGAHASYIDSNGLEWVNDDSNVTIGKSFQQPYVGNNKAFESFRYFPEVRSKYCYTLDTPNVSYLVRASFYMDTSELNARQPFQFILAVDATAWITVASGPPGESQSPLLVVEEGIFYPPNYSTNFCLQPVYGTPFISALELRPLDMEGPDLYSYDGHTSQYLALAFRYNIGGNNSPVVRYPYDSFDRIWTAPDASWADIFPIIHNSTQPVDSDTTSANLIPPIVMQDAWLFPAGDESELVYFSVYPDGPQVFLTPSEYVFAVVYFQQLNSSAPQSYSIDISIDNDPNPGMNFSTKANMLAVPYVVLPTNTINISLYNSIISEHRPSMNAVEVYGQYNYNSSLTDNYDAQVITALKTGFSLTDWQGDPCVPVPFDWVSCDLRLATYGDLQQPCHNTQGATCTVSEVDLRTTYYITRLSISNITNRNFRTIFRNKTAAAEMRLHALDAMSITNSGVDGPIFQFLLEYCISSGLRTLNLSNNAIQQLPQGREWAAVDGITDAGNTTFGNLTMLDLSGNEITGQLSSFEDVPFSNTLQTLILSHNSMTDFPDSWGKTSINSLVTLDLSHNNFSRDISSLNEWIQINSVSLHKLDISHNSLHGVFPSDLYFSGLPQLTVAYFDENSIEGTLNLSAWYAKLQEATRPEYNSSMMPIVTQQLFSFTNNNITDIIPDAKSFDSTTQGLFRKDPLFGVLLRGNPYCNTNESPVQQYLCRSSHSDPFLDGPRKWTKTSLIIGICAGVVALIVLSITAAILWKLWKQVYTLRDIQQALAIRKVQPPFYQYSDLKLATRDFHSSNKLGHGGFGVVYKGVLLGETLAVKKLFNSHKVQVLDEFLNEVVLITGIKHRNLVQLKGCCIKDKQRILVYECAEKGNLAEALWGPNVDGRLDWNQRLHICVGVARGLSYLHEELHDLIIHRDIKPPNILLDRNFNPKIADFGLARHVSSETNQAHYTQIQGTLGYFAPEYATQGEVTEKIDVYSYGILILEVVTGRKCIDSSRPAEETFLKKWVINMRKKGMLFDVLQPELREDCDMAEVIRALNIGLLCVQHHPESRPTMSQVVTMLLGNMPVEVCPDEFDKIDPSFKSFTELVHNDEYHTMHIHEERPAFPLLDPDSQSSFNISSSACTSSSMPVIELSSLHGR